MVRWMLRGRISALFGGVSRGGRELLLFGEDHQGGFIGQQQEEEVVMSGGLVDVVPRESKL